MGPEHGTASDLAMANRQPVASSRRSYVVVTSPFLVRVHELPEYGMFDYWRFTPRGLQLMVEKVGLEVVESGRWGNRMGVMANLTHWSARRRWHPMRSEPEVPVQTWCMASRPH